MSDRSSLTVFDLTSQAGIRSVLFAIRQSELSTPEKNELRDLVLLYTTGGTDESTKISLEKKLSTHGLKPIEPKPQEQPKETKSAKPRLSFGSSRPSPIFSAPTTSFTADNKEKIEYLKPVVDDVNKVEPTIQNVEPKKNSSNLTYTETKIDSKPSVVQTDVDQARKETFLDNATGDVLTKTNFSRVPQPQKPTQGNVVNINRVQKPKTSASVGFVNDQINEKEIIDQASKVVLSQEKEDVPTDSVISVEKNTSKPQSTVVSKITSTTSPTVTRHLNRIREIKSVVNKRVGNPVNLVDIDNQIGREYMNALLEAMKHVNTEDLELERAMERLEKAYLAVERAISENNQTDDVVETNTKLERMSLKTSGFENSKITPESKNETSEKSQKSLDNKTVSKALGLSHISSQEVSQDNPSKTNQPQELNQEKVNIVSGFDKNNSDISDIDLSFKKLHSQTESQSDLSRSSVTDKAIKTTSYLAQSEGLVSKQNQISTPSTRRATSLAEEVRNLTPEDLPETKNTSAEAIGNPLYAPEVDAGLEQLLSDWPLFKKSGLFGTGPKGTEHPLFKKIANLQIPVLLAGRFEGANQEIRQSITDYMNGWRYEQGIIYQQGETFEVYLRRVIRHILDTQKQRRPA